MKINIQIDGATPEQLITIARSLGAKMRQHKGKKDAPYGLKKDGTPAKKRGRRPTKWEI